MTPGEVFREASPSIVVVKTFDSKMKPVAQGSAVVIASNTAVTNCHVFEDASSAQIVYADKAYAATLTHTDTKHDLCVLTTQNLPAPPAQLGYSESTQVGDRVYSIGAPFGLELTLADGLLSGKRKVDDANILQITAPISNGSSGGGLFDDQARLIGITTMFFRESQQLNFAMPIEIIYKSKFFNRHLPARSNTKRVESSLSRNTVSAEIVAFGSNVDKYQNVISPKFIFRQNDKIFANVTIKAGAPSEITAKWTYGRRAGDELQEILSESKLVTSSDSSASFSISNPDAWPIGVYHLELYFDNHKLTSGSFCVVDATTDCNTVTGKVYSYVSDGVRHYVSKPPESNRVEELRTINYSLLRVEQKKRNSQTRISDSNRWVEIYTTADNETGFFDTETMRLSGDKVYVWEKSKHRKPQTVGGKSGVSEMKTMSVFDCANRTLSYTTTILYDSSGEMITSETNPEYLLRRDVVPDTVGEIAWNAACVELKPEI